MTNPAPATKQKTPVSKTAGVFVFGRVDEDFDLTGPPQGGLQPDATGQKTRKSRSRNHRNLKALDRALF